MKTGAKCLINCWQPCYSFKIRGKHKDVFGNSQTSDELVIHR